MNYSKSTKIILMTVIHDFGAVEGNQQATSVICGRRVWGVKRQGKCTKDPQVKN